MPFDINHKCCPEREFLIESSLKDNIRKMETLSTFKINSTAKLKPKVRVKNVLQQIQLQFLSKSHNFEANL